MSNLYQDYLKWWEENLKVTICDNKNKLLEELKTRKLNRYKHLSHNLDFNKLNLGKWEQNRKFSSCPNLIKVIKQLQSH
jgi:hypothetical protein